MSSELHDRGEREYLALQAMPQLRTEAYATKLAEQLNIPVTQVRRSLRYLERAGMVSSRWATVGQPRSSDGWQRPVPLVGPPPRRGELCVATYPQPSLLP